MNDVLDAGARRPRRRGRPARVAGRRPARGRLAYADPGRRLGRRHPDRPPGLDRRGRPRRRDRQGAAGTRWSLEALADPEHAVDRAALDGRRGRAAGAARPLAYGRARLAETLRALPGRAEDAVVRPADVGHVDGDRPLHGDLGALARRARRARASSPRSPTGSGTSPTSASAPATSRSRCTGWTPPTEEFRVALTAPSGDLWAWGPEDAAQTRDRPGVRLLPAGHPARPPRRHLAGRRRAATPTPGWTSRSASPARRARGVRRDDDAADRQLLRLLRRPALGDARDARGRRRSTCSPVTTSPS